MSEANRALVLRWMQDMWNERREATIDELLDRAAVGHSEGMPDFRGVEQFRAYRGALLNAFPDMRLTVDDTVAEGDDVVARWHVNGTHRGDALGIAATNMSVDFWGITWFRFDNGKIVEGWDAWNQGGVIGRLQAA